MKKNKVIALIVMLSIVFVVSFIGFSKIICVKINPIDTSVNYEIELLDEARLYSAFHSYQYINEELIHVNQIENSPNNLEDNLLELVNNDGSSFFIPEPYDLDYTYDPSKLDYHKVSQRYETLFEEAKKKVCKFIDDSNFLKNQELLKEKILNIDIYVCTDTNNTGFFGSPEYAMSAVFYDGAIYINKDLQNTISEFVLVHELFHGVRHFTLEDSTYSTKTYTFSLFEETMTDALTYSCNPYLYVPKNVSADTIGYKLTLPFIYKYLDLYREDALEAFFYGYDEFFEKYGDKDFQVEHDAMVFTFQGFYENPELASLFYSQIITKMENSLEF